MGFPSVTERAGNNFEGFEDFCMKNGSSQGQNLDLTVLCVMYSLGGRGPPRARNLSSPCWWGAAGGRTVVREVFILKVLSLKFTNLEGGAVYHKLSTARLECWPKSF